MRPLFIAGNWKMNPATAEAAVALAEAVKAGVGQAVDVRVAVCPPSVFLHAVDAVLAGSPIGLGGQNMHWKPDGAYTGEISGAMLVDAGCTHVILGHSERRHGMGETDAQVNAKLHAALGRRPDPDRLHRRDPAGARGRTGPRTSSPRQLDRLARRAHARADGGRRPGLRAGLGDRHRPDGHPGAGPGGPRLHPRPARPRRSARRPRPGSSSSMAGASSPTTPAELLACPDIDGALVGGASLKAGRLPRHHRGRPGRRRRPARR